MTFERQDKTYRAECRPLIDVAGRGSRQFTGVTGDRHVDDKLARAWIVLETSRCRPAACRSKPKLTAGGTLRRYRSRRAFWHSIPTPIRRLPVTVERSRACLQGRDDCRCSEAYWHDAGWDQGECGYCAAQGAWLETAAGEN
ncbi:hypothetical protein [Bradyrhizobium sp. ORS 111]|uniref:hypothetical protein n=1 Tax=Bradyrhizobium sp. ORS 111 TaxID=1685958 RepID=UPI00388E1E10